MADAVVAVWGGSFSGPFWPQPATLNRATQAMTDTQALLRRPVRGAVDTPVSGAHTGSAVSGCRTMMIGFTARFYRPPCSLKLPPLHPLSHPPLQV